MTGNDHEDEIHFAPAALVLASTAALAQGNAAGPAGAVDKKGDATSPGETMKK